MLIKLLFEGESFRWEKKQNRLAPIITKEGGLTVRAHVAIVREQGPPRKSAVCISSLTSREKNLLTQLSSGNWAKGGQRLLASLGSTPKSPWLRGGTRGHKLQPPRLVPRPEHGSKQIPLGLRHPTKHVWQSLNSKKSECLLST